MMSFPLRNQLAALLIPAMTGAGAIGFGLSTAAHHGNHSRPASTASPESGKTSREVTGPITVTKAGTVIDSQYVNGNIAVKADNVTIKNTVVDSHSLHSIRIYPGAHGTQILDSTVRCENPRGNGIVFGDYVAERVKIDNCRNDFMSSRSAPATVIDSWVNGKPYESRPSNGPTPPPRHDPSPSSSEPSTPAASPSRASSPGKSSVTPTATASESSKGFPDASDTGVPAGTKLKASGSITVTKDGTVIDGKDVHGEITVKADDVTIRNTRVSSKTPAYPIHVTSGVKGTVIDHVEVDNMDSTGIGIYFQGGSGVVRHANVHSGEDGIRIEADDVTIADSYIHDLFRQPGGHHDIIQIRRGDDVTITGNTLMAYKKSTDDPMNSSIQIGSLLGSKPISNLRVTDNFMDGGNFTVNGGGRGEVSSAVYSGNRFGRDCKYAVEGNLQNSTWSDTNVWNDNGQPAS
jgi:hypothetical protein